MKEICALLLVVVSAFLSVAEAARCKACLKPAPIGATVCSKCAAARKANVDGIVSEIEGRARKQGVLIPDKQGRIETFAGYSLGSAFRKGTGNVRQSPSKEFGSIVVEEKLKKPFRFCTMATLRYAEKNGALYSVTLTSEPQRMSADKAQLEVDGILAVLREKYAKQMTFPTERTLRAIGYAKMFFNSQRFTIEATKVEIPAKARLKGTSLLKEDAYVFTVCLYDGDVKLMPAAPADCGEVDSSTGADVL